MRKAPRPPLPRSAILAMPAQKVGMGPLNWFRNSSRSSLNQNGPTQSQKSPTRPK
ncbi:MAG: hypothetical protein M5U34_15065 [Chloroflexi bacterium]|nr:hypothetical protein [Chloroflexota bacterium]